VGLGEEGERVLDEEDLLENRADMKKNKMRQNLGDFS
jgi:hypothetical protein